MLAGWLAADSLGFLADALRDTLTLAALAVVVAACWPGQLWWADLSLRVAAIGTAALLIRFGAPSIDVLAVTVLLGVVAWQAQGAAKPILAVVTASVGALAVFKLVCLTPVGWLAADAAGAALGRLAASVTGRPLVIGSSFACLDLAIAAVAFVAAWWVVRPARSPATLIGAVVGFSAAHLLYLAILAYWSELRSALPPPPPPPEYHSYIPPPWHWGAALAGLIPWNMPLLAGLLHLIAVGATVRWSSWNTTAALSAGAPGGQPGLRSSSSFNAGTAAQPTAPRALLFGKGLGVSGIVDRVVVAVALLLPVAVTLVPGHCDLEGVTVVAFDDDSTRWEKPQLDDSQIEQFNNYALPKLVTALGAQWVRTQTLDQSTMASADVLLMVHPSQQWPPVVCEQVWQFVRRGGTLLLLADTWSQQQAAGDSFNRLLAPTAISVRFDTAIPLARRWEQGRSALAHPATAVMKAGGSWTELETGATLEVRWPARPILVGRWGWSDPGSDAVLTSTWRLDPGERMGDLVLAAEQSFGKGKVVVLGNASTFSDQEISTSYGFLGGLLASSTGRLHNPQALWRQSLGLIAALAVAAWVALAAAQPGVLAFRGALAALLISAGLVVCGVVNWSTCRVLPDGRRNPGFNNLVYIDATHLEAYSHDPWSFDGLAGLELAMIRADWLPLRLADFRADRLDRAAVLVSIAPGQAFSQAQARLVDQFVERGGTLIVMAGAEESQGAASLLERFHMGLGTFPVPASDKRSEPVPMGYFTTRYRPGEADYDAEIALYAGWPVECEMTDHFVFGLRNQPVIGFRLNGRGNVILIGDTAFAMNKNMWYVTAPFNTRQHNADFWRWLLSFISDQEDWLPPAPQPNSPGADEAQQPQGEAMPANGTPSSETPANDQSAFAPLNRQMPPTRQPTIVLPPGAPGTYFAAAEAGTKQSPRSWRPGHRLTLASAVQPPTRPTYAAGDWR